MCELAKRMVVVYLFVCVVMEFTSDMVENWDSHCFDVFSVLLCFVVTTLVAGLDWIGLVRFKSM